jgi:hypothetical protein
MKNFDEYMLGEILKEEGIELSDQKIRQLIAEGFMDKMKKWGKNAALAGALGAGAMGATSGGQGQAPENSPAPQSYKYQTNAYMGNQGTVDQFNKDMVAMNKGEIPDSFNRTTTSAIEVTAKTILDTALVTQNGEPIFERDKFIEIIHTKDLGSGNIEVVADISGTIMATSKEDAMSRMKNQITQQLIHHGFEVEGLNFISFETQLENAMPAKVKIRVKFSGQMGSK